MPDQTAASRSRPSTKLGDILMSDKPTLSYADFHHQITKNTDGYLPNSFGSQQAHGAEKDELVRYMSNLPSYLEKGKNLQEKPLNVGVLDWRRLEKWRYSNDQVPYKNSGYSSSTSTASCFSTERSSSQSSRGQISSPAQQKGYRSSFQSQLESSSMKKVSQDYNRSPSHQRTYHLVPHSHYQKVYPLEGCSHNVDRIEGVSASIRDRGIRPQNLCEKYRNCTVKECESSTISDTGKGKLKIRESELKEAMQSRCALNLGVNHPDCSKERNTVVLLVPRDLAKNKGAVHSSVPKEFGGKISSEQANLKESHSSVLPIKKKSEVRESCSTNTLSSNVSSQLNSPSRSRNIEQKPSIVVLKSSGELNNNTIKVRHPSPIRRLGSAMGNFVRSAGSRDNTPLRRSTSKDSVSLDKDRSHANGRARSSPLRRLLDPLIRKDEHSNLPKVQSVNVKSTFISSKTKGVKDSSPVQALLQVGVNNGLPVFTFAVENDSDNILAATLSKQKYTFLSVHGMKKKNGLWANQGCKGKGQYTPNVVAQMTVSDQNYTNGERAREFTLFAVDVGQADQNGTEFQPTNELAAIVVKLVKANATVILPGGVHTIPSKGSISTLTNRWRSGGSCDCGGWDLGCQLRVFKSSSKAANVSDEFKLYHQVGQEIELVLRVKPLKERIYSVEVNSSMSLLQAFGTCVTVLDCKILSGLSSTVNGVEGRSSASYVSYPPHSPVSRA